MIKYILILNFLFLLVGCDEEQPEVVRVNVFIDVTDGQDTRLLNIEDDLEKIGQYSGVSETKGGNNGIEFRLFELNNLSESASKTIILESSIPGILGKNTLDRVDEIKEFYKQMSIALNEIHSRKREELNQSKIYQNLCRELNNISSDSTKNLVIVYSDMLENSNLFSFYNNLSQIKEWNKDIDQVVKILENKDCHFPDLSGTAIHIVSKRKEENDLLINEAEIFWTKLFKTTNGDFYFDADLNLPLVYN